MAKARAHHPNGIGIVWNVETDPDGSLLPQLLESKKNFSPPPEQHRDIGLGKKALSPRPGASSMGGYEGEGEVNSQSGGRYHQQKHQDRHYSSHHSEKHRDGEVGGKRRTGKSRSDDHDHHDHDHPSDRSSLETNRNEREGQSGVSEREKSVDEKSNGDSVSQTESKKDQQDRERDQEKTRRQKLEDDRALSHFVGAIRKTAASLQSKAKEDQQQTDKKENAEVVTSTVQMALRDLVLMAMDDARKHCVEAPLVGEFHRWNAFRLDNPQRFSFIFLI